MMENRTARLVGAALLALIGYALYADSLDGPFIFDDMLSIVESPNIRKLWPLSESMSAQPGSGASGRPLVALSLALNYASAGLDVRAYHLFNVVLHLLTALALFAFARRALVHTKLASQATTLAFAGALLWVVHPLNTDALNHVITRNEVLPAFFILTCLWATDHSAEEPQSKLWTVLAILASCAAMASKEIAVALPLIVLGYDRTFLAGSFKQALRERRFLYAGLAASWIVLALSIASGNRGVAVGFGHDMTSIDYLRTQAQGLVHYLRLVVWPSGLAVDYSGWAPVRSWGPALLPGGIVLALLLGSLIAFVRGKRSGWVALSIFAILAPSSSFIPITGEWLGEHRMYLPLTGLVLLIVSGGAQLVTRLAKIESAQIILALAVLFAIPLGMATRERNTDYESVVSIWEDCLDKYPNNARANDHLAVHWLREREYSKALVHAERALELDPTLYTVDYNLATILQQLGQHERALEHFERAAQHLAADPRFHTNYGVALGQVGRSADAVREFQRAIELSPDYALAHRNLGSLLMEEGDSAGAVVLWRRSIELQPDVPTIMRMIRVLAGDPDPEVRNGAEALSMSRALLNGGRPDPRWFDLLGMSHAELGQFDAALEAARKALQGARQLGQTKLAGELEQRIAGYQAGQAFRSNRP